MGSLLILLVIVAAVAFFAVALYNGLVTARNAFRNAFAQIDVQLQRRFDLIPNLVETAKGYLRHERETLEAVTAARGAAMSGLAAAKANPGDPAAMAELAQSQGMLNSALGRLMMVAEAYPDLKANQNMMQLTEELTSTENRVAFARQAFNDSVMAYNNKREVFPSSVVAGMFGFDAAALLEIPADGAGVREAPTVQFQRPMTSFEQQAQARRNSTRLVVLFALAVAGIVLAIDAAVFLVAGANWALLAFTTLATVAVIGLGSLYRLASLRGGGDAVALQFGGTPVPQDTTDASLRRLRNVVEEVSIASGVPVPSLYVLEGESAINAFAAGYSASDAAIAVTRGALDRLNRDELQGVIAHEFSHVL